MKTAAVEGGRGRMRAVEVTRAEPALWGLVGNTPLIPLPPSTALARPLPAAFLKAEWFNPGGSVKDRPALFILRDGIARGELPAKRLLDASSGNTAIAYAMLGAAAGIGVTVCVPANASAERKALLETYGAEVIFTDPLDGSDGAIRAAAELGATRCDDWRSSRDCSWGGHLGRPSSRRSGCCRPVRPSTRPTRSSWSSPLIRGTVI